MQHFQDVEIAKVRMEEKRKFHKEFDKLKQELERNYEMKAKALIEREKNAIDRLQKQQEVDFCPTLDFLIIFSFFNGPSTSAKSKMQTFESIEWLKWYNCAFWKCFMCSFVSDWREKCVHAEAVNPKRNWHAAEQREWASHEDRVFRKVSFYFCLLMNQ